MDGKLKISDAIDVSPGEDAVLALVTKSRRCSVRSGLNI
jgi:hypothetical protein